MSKIVLPSAQLILLMGSPCTGKTTIAEDLVRKIHAVRLWKDRLQDAPNPARDLQIYQAQREIVYAVMYGALEDNLKAGNSCLLEAPHVTQMREPPWRDMISKMVESTDSTLKIIRCYTSEEELKRRMIARKDPRDRWKLEDWQGFMKKEPIMVDIPFDHINIDTSARIPPYFNMDKIMLYLTDGLQLLKGSSQ
jgi:predicted kinase